MCSLFGPGMHMPCIPLGVVSWALSEFSVSSIPKVKFTDLFGDSRRFSLRTNASHNTVGLWHVLLSRFVNLSSI